jgi:23S rRNA pseudouridine2605 synthase
MDRAPKAPASDAPRHGVARVISKRGITSRTEAAAWVRAGRVRVNGRTVLDPEFPVRADTDRLEIEGIEAAPREFVAVMLNKPRGLVTTVRDERGRDTVYRCLDGSGLPWLSPVGRLDKASEGLLLFCNDPVWAAGVTDPVSAVAKTYHVQIDRIGDEALLGAMVAGLVVDGERLACRSARLLRSGARRSWVEVVIEEGRNRQIRRLLEACGVDVVRLLRTAIGSLELGALPKGGWRHLSAGEVTALVPPGP